MANTSSKAVSARKGEHDISISFRSNRIFAIGTDWYFSTREGIDHGPYLTKEIAEYEINNYICATQL